MYRKTYAEIDIEAIKGNIRGIVCNIPATSGVIAVVKADAYGHGVVRTAQAALTAGACMLAVAIAEEAMELREAEIAAPILVIGHSNREQQALALELDLELCIFDCADIRTLQEIACARGKTARIHLKIDTGMGRIGVRDDSELERILTMLQKCPDVQLTGVFTHFSCADHADKACTYEQDKRFLRFVDALKKAGYAPKIHAANSATAIDLPELSYDYIRYGIAMYGCYPSRQVEKDRVKLMPAMQVFAEISHIKTVSKGTPIGYGATYVTPAKATIATVQIGYGDGYNRLLSNRGRMIVSTADGSRYASIVGRVCMDQTMIDITDMDGVQVGDCVIVMGNCGDKRVSADDIADMCGTINYEILLDYNKRIPRVYR